VAIEVPPGSQDIRMPPMMLLPLVDHAVVRGLEPRTEDGAISIRSEVHDGRLQLRIADSGAGFVPEPDSDGIASIRNRLEALYGGSATLALRRVEDSGTEAVLENPLQARGYVEGLEASLQPSP